MTLTHPVHVLTQAEITRSFEVPGSSLGGVGTTVDTSLDTRGAHCYRVTLSTSLYMVIKASFHAQTCKYLKTF